MTAQTSKLDPKIFSLLTGELGSQQAMSKICGDMGLVLAAFLPDMVEIETQLKLNFFYEGCETGSMTSLIADLDEYMVLVDGELKNWCSDFVIACPAGVIIAMVECLMGGDLASISEPEARPASSIELEMAPMMTNRIASVIKSAVNAPGNFEPLLSKPYNADKRPKPADDYVDTYAALIWMKVEFGALVSRFGVIVPQKTLLKTVVKAPAVASSAHRSSTQWADVLQEQVRRSDVRVEARIHLTPLKLGAITQLKPGDVIPFLDKQDVRVQVSANGRDLYSCEFGRAGEQYTVRVKDTAGSEEDLLRDILG